MVSLRALLASSALIAAPVLAAVGSPEVGKVFRDLDSQVFNLQPVAESINAENAALLLQGGGPLPVLFDGFSHIMDGLRLVPLIVLADGPPNSRPRRRSRAPVPADGPDGPEGPEGPDGMQTSKTYATRFLQHTGDLFKTLRDKAPVLQGAPVAIPRMIDGIRELQNEYGGIADSIDRLDRLFGPGGPLGEGFESDSSDVDSSDDEGEGLESDSDVEDGPRGPPDSSLGEGLEDDGSDDEDEGFNAGALKQVFRGTRDAGDAALDAVEGLVRSIPF